MLTLKYRPQSIGDLVGQDDVKLALEKAFTNNKIASAYLLTGPRGAGKTSTARIIAKSLNCKSKQAGEKATLTPCGKCSSCINIANSNDIDVVEIDAASHGGVDDARELVVKASLSAINSDYKIYIIDEVHMASKDAFNALLKLFEEPPANVVFILATTESHKVLPTISSRCQQFRFKPINKNDCFKRLKDICEIENIYISDDALKFITEESDGALRDALSILEQVSVFNEESSVISKELVEKTLGKVSEKEVLDLLFLIIGKQAMELLQKIEKIFYKNPDPQILTAELFQATVKLLEELCLSDGLEELKPCIELIRNQNIYKAEILYIAEEISKYEVLLKQSSQANKLFKALCLKLSLREDFINIQELRERIIKLEEALGAGFTRAPLELVKPKVINEAVKVETLEAPQPRQINQETPVAVSEGTSFMQFLSPATKGLIVSSKANLLSNTADKAILVIPEKFKFLKSKLENKSEELLQAIKQADNPSVKNIEINIGSEADFKAEAVSAVSTAIPQVSLNMQPAGGSQELSKASLLTETCCDREAKLDEVLRAGISIFGGNVVQE